MLLPEPQHVLLPHSSYISSYKLTFALQSIDFSTGICISHPKTDIELITGNNDMNSKRIIAFPIDRFYQRPEINSTTVTENLHCFSTIIRRKIISKKVIIIIQY